jgi:hypothetical protein
LRKELAYIHQEAGSIHFPFGCVENLFYDKAEAAAAVPSLAEVQSAPRKISTESAVGWRLARRDVVLLVLLKSVSCDPKRFPWPNCNHKKNSFIRTQKDSSSGKPKVQ